MMGCAQAIQVHSSTCKSRSWRSSRSGASSRILRNSAAYEQRLDFRELTVFHSQTQGDRCGATIRTAGFLANRSDEGDLPRLGIGNEQPVLSPSDDGFPMGITDLQSHAVLRKL